MRPASTRTWAFARAAENWGGDGGEEGTREGDGASVAVGSVADDMAGVAGVGPRTEGDVPALQAVRKAIARPRGTRTREA